ERRAHPGRVPDNPGAAEPAPARPAAHPHTRAGGHVPGRVAGRARLGRWHMTRHFLRDDDLTPDEQAAVLDIAATMKADRYGHRPLAGPRSVAVVFEKPSLRTRVSFDAGIAELGGHPIVIDARATHFGRGETVADGAAPDAAGLRRAAGIAARTGGSVEVGTDPAKAVAGADVVATDTWTSMGQESDGLDRVGPFRPYQVNTDLLAGAAPRAVVLH